MGFFSSLLGKDSAKAAEQLGQRSMQRTNQGYDTANQYAKTGYDTSMGRYQPLYGQAQSGYNLLADSYGLNGDAARDKAYASYSSDPFNAQSGQITQNLLGNIMNTAASRGMGNSGATQLAMSRAGLEAQDRRVADWRSGLTGFGNQAVGIAGNMAGLDQNYYGGMADREVGRAGALNQTDANATMAASNAKMSGITNLLSGIGNIAGMAFQGFAPGKGGTSTWGNVNNYLSGKAWA